MAKKKKRTGNQKPNSDATRAKAEEKKARRLARQEEELKVREATARKRKLKTIAYSALGVLVVGGLLFVAIRPGPEVEGVVKERNSGRNHAHGATYETATPTSGTHSSSSAACGVYPEPLELSRAVHALEHGVVVVWYRPDLAEDQIQELTGMVDRWTSHVIVSPNHALTDPIVATAWRRLKSFDSVGEGIAEFVDTYRERGPERIPCSI